MSPPTDTVLSVSSRALVDACDQLGVDVTVLLQSAELDRAVLNDPDARIPSSKVAKLWQEAYRMSGDANLALHAVEALPFGAYKVLDFAAASAASVGEAFGRISDYFPLINDTVSLPIHVGDVEVTFSVVNSAGAPAVSLPYAEYTLGACYLRVHDLLGGVDLLRVEFTHDAPPDTSEHERIFRAPVHFGRDQVRLVFAREVWDRPNVRSNPALGAVLDQHARELISDLADGGPLRKEVSQATLAELRGGTPTLEQVAGRLGMSGRTLQRRLRETNLSFAALLDDLRHGMAQTYLADRQISICEVAYLLGFSEQSAFQRAFRRWTGTTPLQYRKAQ